MISPINGPDFAARIRRAEQVQAACVRCRDALLTAQPTWTKQDVRQLSLGQCVNVSTSLILSFGFIDQSLTKVAWWERHIHGPIDRQLQLTEFDNFVKIGFSQMLFSIADGSMRAVLRKIDPSAANSGRASFESVRAALFARIGHAHVADADYLTLFRLLRNCIHNNGIHRPHPAKSQDINYRGRAFSFVDGKAIDFADWEVVLQLAEDMPDLLLRLWSCPVVVGIPPTILA